ncbi:MAG: recombinase family protein [Polyangiaceae bacterium]
MRALPYLRVSTDDKGQEPLRQLDVIRPWAAREDVELLDPEIDEGTSASKTNPFERPRFVAACERAKAGGADAIVVEVGDRFGRRGSMEGAWAEHEVWLRYGLKLWRADKPLAQHGTMVARVTDTIHDEGAREWVHKHQAKVRSGMARAKAECKRMGRPPKSLTDEQIALVRRMRAEGVGWRRIARAVSEARGAYKLADPKKQRERAVTHAHVARVAAALGIP